MVQRKEGMVVKVVKVVKVEKNRKAEKAEIVVFLEVFVPVKLVRRMVNKVQVQLMIWT